MGTCNYARDYNLLFLIAEDGPRLVISVSLAKYVRARNTDVTAYPGTTIPKIIDEILFGKLDMSGFARIMIHMGTNDLANLIDNGDIQYFRVESVMCLFRLLRDVIRRRNSRAILIFASLPPRLERFDLFFPYQYGLNHALEKWCAKSTGSIFYARYKPFMAWGRPRDELYARDGLHFNGAGVEVLEAVIQQAFSSSSLLDQINSKRRHRLASVTY